MRLIDKYQECTIQPALKIYRKMLDCMEQANEEAGQLRNELQRDRFFSWFTDEEQSRLNELWINKKRIPQEVLTIETWRRWM